MEYKNDFKCSSSARSADYRPNTAFERGKPYADQAASESTRNLRDQTASKSEDIAGSPQKNCRRKKSCCITGRTFSRHFRPPNRIFHKFCLSAKLGRAEHGFSFSDPILCCPKNSVKSFRVQFSRLPELHFHAAGAYVKEDGKHKNDAAYCVLIGLSDAHEVHAVLERR